MHPDSGLPALARSPGAASYGVADLTGVQDFIRARGGKRVTGYPRAVVMGIRLLDTLVGLLEDRTDSIATALYRHTSYDVVNAARDAGGPAGCKHAPARRVPCLPGPRLHRSAVL